ncbi:hypothetical protein [Thalassospira profundimaris]|uniref:Helix-destabilizing protein n=1 Tax=Thalassospira profundimaris TaxID=502049 RepID=A0A367WP46_9PROT|nr:hypothetical protein [Thalassospira profundimaris]RCK43177.1 hypothetical protein TH30_19335 [Thalassospira profundimaris]
MDIGIVAGFVHSVDKRHNQHSGNVSAHVVIGSAGRKFTDKDTGELREYPPQWERVVFYGGAADVILKHVKPKAKNMVVVGERRTYQGTNGNYYSYIRATDFLLPIPAEWMKGPEGGSDENPADDLPPAPDLEDEIPY